MRCLSLPVTVGPGVSWQAETVSSLVTSVALLIVRVTLGWTLGPGRVTLAPPAGSGVKPRDSRGSEVSWQTVLAVDPVRLVSTVDTDSTTGVFPRSVQASPLRLNLGVEVTLV